MVLGLPLLLMVLLSSGLRVALSSVEIRLGGAQQELAAPWLPLVAALSWKDTLVRLICGTSLSSDLHIELSLLVLRPWQLIDRAWLFPILN